MADHLADSLLKVKLTDEEEDSIVITGANRAIALEECEHSLLGRFLTHRPPNLRAAKSTLRTAWRMGDEVRMVDVGPGLIQFKFRNAFQMRWVLEHSPWNFDNHLLLLRRWESGMTPANLTFTHALFWIQVWGVPFDLMTEEVGEAIGHKIGRFIKVDRSP
jgi:hypothetical protein